MQIRVSHITRYTYDRPVFLQPHVLRLRPRCDGTQWVDAFRLHVLPKPLGTSHWSDYEGNASSSVWFQEQTTTLTVASSFSATTVRDNPFDFILEPRATMLPMPFSVAEIAALQRYRQRGVAAPSVDELVAGVMNESGGLSSFFVTRLTARLHELCGQVVRTHGDPLAPTETLRRRGGACRDVAVLFMEACRIAGLPARFVSGYYLGDIERERHELHAWAEVYLPGAGWRGFDPTTGLAVGPRHVAVAAAARPEDATPVSGSFYGAMAQAGRVESTLTVDLEVSEASESGSI